MPPSALPAIALLAGAACGLHLHAPAPAWLALLAACVTVAIAGVTRGAWPPIALAVVCGCWSGGAALAGHARDAALETSLRARLDGAFGGFAMGT